MVAASTVENITVKVALAPHPDHHHQDSSPPSGGGSTRPVTRAREGPVGQACGLTREPAVPMVACSSCGSEVHREGAWMCSFRDRTVVCALPQMGRYGSAPASGEDRTRATVLLQGLSAGQPSAVCEVLVCTASAALMPRNAVPAGGHEGAGKPSKLPPAPRRTRRH